MKVLTISFNQRRQLIIYETRTMYLRGDLAPVLVTRWSKITDECGAVFYAFDSRSHYMDSRLHCVVL